MTTLWQDLLYGFRVLLKKPGFTAVAALSLALGIGANAVIFSLMNTTLLRPLPFPDAGRLMIVWTVPQQKPDQRNNPNVSSFNAFHDRNQSFEELGAINGGVTNIAAEQDGAPAERINGWLFSPAIFKALGVQPRLGRLYNDAEDQVENPAPVVVLSHRFWETHFNSDPNIVGKIMTMDKVPNTIIGVMPKGFAFFQDDFDYYAPLPINRTQSLSRAFCWWWGGSSRELRLSARRRS